MKKIFIAIVLASISLAANAKESDSIDLLAMDLEQLINEKLTSTIASGLHHTHPKGEWMLGYSYMYMKMSGNRDGTNGVGTAEIVSPTGFNFIVTPTRMDMRMHMFEVMYGYSDNLTFMVMLPYKEFSMDHITRSGITFTTRAEGIGDLSLSGLYTFYKNQSHRMHFTVGMSLPTGSIDEEDGTPASMGVDAQLPYPMQLGSGTFDVLAGLTYLGLSEHWTWGANVLGMIRLGENDNDYTLGDRYNADLWVSRQWNRWVSTPVRLFATTWGDISGADPALDPAVVPTADPERRAGTRFDLGIGLNIYLPDGTFQGNRIAIEHRHPIYQKLDGPQLETDWQSSITWQWAF